MRLRSALGDLFIYLNKCLVHSVQRITDQLLWRSRVVACIKFLRMLRDCQSLDERSRIIFKESSRIRAPCGATINTSSNSIRQYKRKHCYTN
jgi:hypothetical protein